MIGKEQSKRFWCMYFINNFTSVIVQFTIVCMYLYLHYLLVKLHIYSLIRYIHWPLVIEKLFWSRGYVLLKFLHLLALIRIFLELWSHLIISTRGICLEVLHFTDSVPEFDPVNSSSLSLQLYTHQLFCFHRDNVKNIVANYSNF